MLGWVSWIWGVELDKLSLVSSVGVVGLGEFGWLILVGWGDFG